VHEGHNVTVIDNLSTGKLENLNPRARLVRMDIRDKALGDVFDEIKPEAVYHFAAQIKVQNSLTDPLGDADLNIAASIQLLECCRLFGARKIIYASSAAVYGHPQYLGIDEAHPVRPLSPYGVSKYVPEAYMQVYQGLYGLRYTVLRFANVYGIRQTPDGEGGVVSAFISNLKEGKSFIVTGDGEQTRDFINVKDIAGACVHALTRAENRVINVGCGEAVTVNTLLSTMADIAGKPIRPSYVADRPGDIKHSYYNTSVMRAVLGFTPAYSLADGLRDTMAYYGV